MTAAPTKIAAVLDRIRSNIPTACRDQFRAVTADYTERLSRAVAGGPEYHALAEQLWQRVQDLEHLELASLPPHLYREPGEPIRDYLARCYAAENHAPDPTLKRKSLKCRIAKHRHTPAFPA
jgi:hypothetical protein